MFDLETRYYPTSQLGEVRASEGEDGKKVVEGRFIPYNELSVDMGGWKERIAVGAFDDSMDDDLRMFWNHEYGKILARRGNKSLDVESLKDGVYFRGRLINTTHAEDAYKDINSGLVTGASFGFRLLSYDGEQWDEAEDGMLIRTVLRGKLYEGSPVIYPAYPTSDVSSRAAGTEEGVLERGRKAIAEKRQLPPEAAAEIAQCRAQILEVL